jgi:hypothetical protein
MATVVMVVMVDIRSPSIDRSVDEILPLPYLQSA